MNDICSSRNTGAPNLWDLNQLRKAPQTFHATEVRVDPLRSFYFEGEPFNGKPTTVFGFYGVPPYQQGVKVPAVVLVHGGGGSALSDWVKLWNSRGYAAIAFDHNGTIPVGTHHNWQKNPNGGPPLQTLEQIDWPITDQWMYHAVADTMRACSLLESFPEIDRNQIGLTGVSWGAVVSCVVAGIDSRFKFVAPVYGCGFISGEDTDGSSFVGADGTDAEKLRRWRELWDPSKYLSQATAPFVWVTGTNDFAFTLKSLQSSYYLVTTPQWLSVHVRMVHGHDGPGEKPEEICALADHLARGALQLTRVLKVNCEENRAWVEYQSSVPLSRAELIFTLDTGRWQDRYWNVSKASIDASHSKVTVHIPDKTKSFFFNLIDERGLVVSSERISVRV